MMSTAAFKSMYIYFVKDAYRAYNYAYDAYLCDNYDDAVSLVKGFFSKYIIHKGV